MNIKNYITSLIQNKIHAHIHSHSYRISFRMTHIDFQSQRNLFVFKHKRKLDSKK